MGKSQTSEDRRTVHWGGGRKRDNVYSWEELITLSNDVSDEQLQERLNITGSKQSMHSDLHVWYNKKSKGCDVEP